MTPYENLANHLQVHAYRKGANKGDAPLYKHRRHKSACRVMKAHKFIDNQSVECMVVRMFATDIMVVPPDGRVRINLGGWESSPTTCEAINEALSIAYKHLPKLLLRIHSLNKFSISTMVLTHTEYGFFDGPLARTKRKSYRYYPNMTLDADATMTTDPVPFQARRIDREASKDIARALKASGFMDVLPVLWETAERESVFSFHRHSELLSILSDPERAHLWPGIVYDIKHFARNPSTPQETRKRLLTHLRAPLHRHIDTDITCIEE